LWNGYNPFHQIFPSTSRHFTTLRPRGLVLARFFFEKSRSNVCEKHRLTKDWCGRFINPLQQGHILMCIYIRTDPYPDISITATHCNTLQHTATHCNTLQHTATHCNTPYPYKCIFLYIMYIFVYSYSNTSISIYVLFLYKSLCISLHIPICLKVYIHI